MSTVTDMPEFLIMIDDRAERHLRAYGDRACLCGTIPDVGWTAPPMKMSQRGVTCLKCRRERNNL